MAEVGISSAAQFQLYGEASEHANESRKRCGGIHNGNSSKEDNSKASPNPDKECAMPRKSAGCGPFRADLNRGDCLEGRAVKHTTT